MKRVLIVILVVVVIAGVAAFIWATKSGQMDDLETPGQRMLFDDDAVSRPDDSSTGSKQPPT